MKNNGKNFQEKPQSSKYAKLRRRKTMLTAEAKKVVGGIIIQGKHKGLLSGNSKGLVSTNHNETFLTIQFAQQ